MVPQTASLVFSINTNGSNWQPLIVFGSPAASSPYSSLTLDGNEFFLMTRNGGDMSNWNGFGYGAIYGFSDVGLGINEATDLHSINIYPNPNNGVFTMVSNEILNDNNRIEISNVLGEIVYSAALNSNKTEINISMQSAGVYLYKVFSRNGNILSMGKIVVQ